MESEYGGFFLFNRGPDPVASQSSEVQPPRETSLATTTRTTAGVEATILTTLEAAPSWKADFEIEPNVKDIGQPQIDVLVSQDLKGAATTSAPATTCSTRSPRFGSIQDGPDQSECEGGDDLHSNSQRPHLTNEDSTDCGKCCIGENRRSTAGPAPVACKLQYDHSDRSKCDVGDDPPTPSTASHVSCQELVGVDAHAVFISTPRAAKSIHSLSSRSNYECQGAQHLQDSEDFMVFDAGIEKRSAPSLSFWAKHKGTTRDSKRKQAAAAAKVQPGPNGQQQLRVEDKLAKDQDSFFRVQMPEPYTGLWCRRSKELGDLDRHYAEHGALVSGHVEDGGEWLRIDSTIFLPMRMGNVDIMEPVPPTIMVFGMQEGWLTRTSRALARFAAGWGGSTSHDNEVTGGFLPSCGCAVVDDTTAILEEVVCRNDRADMVFGTRQHGA